MAIFPFGYRFNQTGALRELDRERLKETIFAHEDSSFPVSARSLPHCVESCIFRSQYKQLPSARCMADREAGN